MTDRVIFINGVYLRPTAVDGIEKSPAGKARVHLTGGATIDVPLYGDQTIRHVGDFLWPSNTAAKYTEKGKK